MLVLGVAGVRSKDIKKYYGQFLAYLKDRHMLSVSKELKTDKWLIRRIQPPFRIDYGHGGILKAGETAGFLNPMGEGISSALESGYGAALAVVSDFDQRQNVIADYKRNTAETREYMIRQWRLVGRMSNKFAFVSEK